MKIEWGKTLDFLRNRKKAYMLTFGTPAGEEVLRDLIKFCRGAETCYHDDPRKHAVLEGRREVFLRISRHLHLNSEQLFTLYSGGGINLRQEETND